jgi:octaprenyl-diphosphate synthase
MSEWARELATSTAAAVAFATSTGAHGAGSTGAAAVLHDALGLVGDDLALAERELARLLESPVAIIPDIGGHLAFAGGKRFRPLLTALSALAAEYRAPSRITIAAVGELLHTATLLHDDVIDRGEFRRGRPTARMKWGNGMAVLTGDYCLARALQAVGATGELAAIRSMSDTVVRMAEGEVAQLQACGDHTLDRDRYAMVIDRKTAALVAWCSSVAGLPDARFVVALQRYGTELGFAFQIADDVLDFSTAQGETGKEPGQDLRDGKLTLPLIFACEADPLLHARVRAALQGGAPMPAATAQSLFDAVVGSEALRRAAAVAQDHADRACESLAALPPSRARTALEHVASYVVRRTR